MNPFNKWLNQANRGSRLVYYKGLLGKDRWSWHNGHFETNALHVLGLIAWKAYRDGRVTLVQHRNGDFDYDYIAIKR